MYTLKGGITLLTKTNTENKKNQVQMVSLDQLVPENHLLRKIEDVIDWSFIYELVEDKYCKNNGRPSLDPVTLMKLPIIQYMFGISSMRKTIEEIEVNVAYRWFLGLDFYDAVPHFTTFGKNYKRRFEGTDLFEQIFQKVLLECMKSKVVNTDTIFVDATHIKACANRKKSKKVLVAKKEARYYDDALKEEIRIDRELHDKKPLKDNDDDNNLKGGIINTNLKEKKESAVDPESGWFHKGEHKEVFAYAAEAACDEYGWILGYTIHPGNDHDSKTFPFLYEKLKGYKPNNIVMDAGYKTPAIVKMLIDDGITPVLPYKRPMTKKGFYKKYEYVYDEKYDCYLCPNNQILKYSTTNREGYKEYKSDKTICKNCPLLSKCTLSKNHQKVVTRHVWEEYMEQCEEIRLSNGIKEIYAKRKETIERIFGTAKERHQMRYTQEIGKEKMQMKVGLTFACMNLKKLVKTLELRDKSKGNTSSILQNFLNSMRFSIFEQNKTSFFNI
jgi:transposase